MLIIVVLLSLLVVLLSYLLYINYRRAEKAALYCEVYVRFVSALYFKFRDTKERLKEVDRLGAFEADDEVGFVFKDIDESINSLYEFITKYINAEQNEEAKKTKD